MGRARQIVLYVIGVLIAWYYFTKLLDVPTYIVPGPIEVSRAMITDWSLLWTNLKITVLESAVGAVVGFTLGLWLAILVFYSKIAEHLIEPFVIASQTFPKEALAPLFLVWFGFGWAPKALISTLICFFPVFINTHRGLESTKPEHVNLMRVVGANERQLFFRVRVPSAAPYILSSLRMCATLSVIGAVVGEFVGSSGGLGHVIRASNAEVATSRIFASLILLGVIGAVFYSLASYLENIVFARYTSSDPKSGNRQGRAL